MPRLLPLRTLLLAIALAAPLLRAAVEKPDIVFIYCDDLRWDALGVVQKEQGASGRFPWIQTPHLDRLAAQSVRFRESFVVTSLCSPGRAAVMTSRYGHHTGIIGNGAHLPPETPTFARQLRGAGYTTAYCGKWHMRDQRERPHYDFVASFVGQGRYFDCPILLNGTETPTKGWIDDVSTDYAIRFLEQQPAAKPFFLWLGFKSPHGPRGGANLPERVQGMYADSVSRPTPNTSLTAIFNRGAAAAEPAPAPKAKGGNPGQAQAHRDYFRHVTALDSAVGRLLDALERTGRAQRTLVIFTSDNGYYLGEHGLGDKRSAYDESLRVPLLVRLPGATRTGTSEAMALNLDYAPTILDFAGAEPLPGAQGRSLRAPLAGQVPADWRTAFFYEYFREANFASPTVLAVRTATHKHVLYPGKPAWTEVFDLRADPYETRNLAADAALAASLRERQETLAREAGFRWPAGYDADGAEPEAVAKGKAAKKKKN